MNVCSTIPYSRSLRLKKKCLPHQKKNDHVYGAVRVSCSSMIISRLFAVYNIISRPTIMHQMLIQRYMGYFAVINAHSHTRGPEVPM